MEKVSKKTEHEPGLSLESLSAALGKLAEEKGWASWGLVCSSNGRTADGGVRHRLVAMYRTENGEYQEFAPAFEKDSYTSSGELMENILKQLFQGLATDRGTTRPGLRVREEK